MKKRGPKPRLATVLTKELLWQKYIVGGKSGPQIASEVGCSSSVVGKYLKKHGIPTRSISESKRGRRLSAQHRKSISQALKGKLVGEKNPFFGRRHSEETKRRIGKANTGNRWSHSEEAKKKIGAAHRGKKYSKKTREKIAAARRGQKHSEESKKKISVAVSGERNPMWQVPRPDMVGRNNPSWKGGITKLSQLIRTTCLYSLWRQEVYERDGYTCQMCGDQTSGNLNADHIIPFSFLLQEYSITSLAKAKECEELWDIDNGRTLCVDCHKQTDTWGYKAANYLRS